MSFVVIARLAVELTLLYTALGYFASLYALEKPPALPYAVILAVGYTCYLVSRFGGKHKWLRFLPLLLLAAVVPFAGVGGDTAALVSNLIVLIPAAALIVVRTARNDFEVEYYGFYAVFSKTVFVVAAVCAAFWLTEKWMSGGFSPVIPSALHFIFGVALLRTLRQERDIYSSARYQLTNLALVGGVGALSAAVGSPFVRERVILPAARRIGAALSRFNEYLNQTVFAPPQYSMQPKITPRPAHTNRFFEVDPEATVRPRGQVFRIEIGEHGGSLPEWSGVVFAALIALALLALLLFVASRRKKGAATWKSSRADADTRPPKARAAARLSDSLAQRVRGVFRRFLALAAQRGVVGTGVRTSEEVCADAVLKGCDAARAQELRALYIRARYSSLAVGAEDVRRAKKLLSEIKRGWTHAA